MTDCVWHCVQDKREQQSTDKREYDKLNDFLELMQFLGSGKRSAELV